MRACGLCRSWSAVSVAALLMVSGRAMAQPVLINSSDVTINPGDTTIVDQATSAVVPLTTAQITVRGQTLTINGRRTIASLAVERNASNLSGVVTHSPGFSFDYSGGAQTDVVYGMHLIVTGNVSVQGAGAGGLVFSGFDATGRGFGSATGPGAGGDSNNGGIGAAGAGHGGNGGYAGPFPGGIGYGSVLQPAEFGSGGGSYVGNPGGPGGGSIHLAVGGTLQVDGVIQADGLTANNPSGSGSGGSVWISAANLTGGGVISTLGVTGFGGQWGPSGGGRIAVYGTTSGFTGVMRAQGGAGGPQAGAGTVYLKPSGRGTLIVDNSAGAYDAQTELQTGSYDADLIVRNGSNVRPRQGDVPTYSFTGSVTVGSACLMGPRPGVAGFTVNVAGNMSVQAGSAVDATGRGYPGQTGPGAGGDSSNGSIGGAGGAYGGNGGRAGPFSGGVGYGSVTQPVDMGSGGGSYVGNPAGPGGGAIRLIVGGTLDVSGVIQADGLALGNSSSGAGSGGSVWITAATLTGNGVISANGSNGSGGQWGPGGGGRVAIYAATAGFTGQARAWGGSGNSLSGGAGTVWVKPAGRATLTIDNNMGAGIAEPTELPGDTFDANAFVRSGAEVRPRVGVGTLTVLGDVNLGANCVLGPRPGSPITLSIGGNAQIGATATIDASGRGYAGQTGPGAGSDSSNGGVGGPGGGYGGNGGRAGPFLGGVGYGSVTQPVDMGSGGGSYVGNPAGPGGGAIRFIVQGTLDVSGVIQADGQALGNSSSGAGSGGSVWITASTLTGNGLISANGSNGGNGQWGPGGGGRVAIYAAMGGFTGQARAWGGLGNSLGGAGTVWVKPGGKATLTIDNNLASGLGEPTELPGDTFDANMAVRNGAEVRPRENSTTISFSGDVTVGAVGVIGSRPQSPVTLLVGGNGVIDAGGLINASGRGFPGQTGPGAGGDSNSGGFGAAGGAHGGDGAPSGPFPGGVGYGSITQPTMFGSGGGSFIGNPAGSGGGAIRVSVGGSLVINGTVSADGSGIPGSSSGSGAGGSIWIDAGTLGGNGLVSASGAGLGGGYWGPGGGGRIALYSSAGSFVGIARASGGAARNSGGAGTVYTKVGTARANLKIDNFDPSVLGSPTELGSATYDVNLTVRAGAQVRPVAGEEAVLTVRGNLLVQSNSMIGPRVGEPGWFWTIGGNAVLEAGSRVDADARGFAGAQGPGAGQDSNSGSFGAAGGGYGGMGASAGPFVGGAPYGSNTQPLDMGSGGGSFLGLPAGAGGGAVRLTVTGGLTIDGTISADGSGSGGNPSGCGSGGSVWIAAANVSGAGVVSASGGSGGWGAGGGGRIAIYSCNQAGTVTLRVDPGTANQPASPGTIFTSGTSTVTVTSQPQNQQVFKGTTVHMAVSATTTQAGGLTYQWRVRDGTGAYQPIANGGRFSGATSAVLTITNATCSDTSYYAVFISDACGVYPSDAARLIVSAISDVCGIGGPPAVPDGLITGDDFIAFINAFADGGDMLADITGIGGPPAIPDGLITGDDFVAFINDFASGCP